MANKAQKAFALNGAAVTASWGEWLFNRSDYTQ
jgi:hypothetical protein